MIFDTHAHYSDESFREDRDALLTGLAGKGIGRIVEIGAGIASTKDAVELAQRYDFVYAAIGVHPSEVDELAESHMDWLEELSRDPKVLAVGEIGLDYHYEEPGRELQKQWFIRQLQLAAKLQMPVVIHSRDAAQDTWELMQEYCAWDNGGVIHCFSYSPEIAKQYLDQGFYLGIGGVLTFKNSKKLKDVVKMAPISQIVLETDAPYLTPEPNRGKRNDSANLTYVVDAIAELKGISGEEVIQITEKNAEILYRLCE